MLFVYKYWEQFCKKLNKDGIVGIPAKDVRKTMKKFLVLKHDVENTVPRAYRLAEIEYKYGHRGSYYVHAYLLNNRENVELLKKMQKMGHEISYHHDVMDSSHGDLKLAKDEFEKNRILFEDLGFHICTVCQHGNPVIERVGYSSNRDFFRSKHIQELYPDIADIMVNYKAKYQIDYTYYSDAGRKFKLIFDPINNDIVKSDDKNIEYESLDEMLASMDQRAIISTHPHRWTESAVSYVVKEKAFRVVKLTARILMKIPVFKKIMSRYYYLAKKI